MACRQFCCAPPNSELATARVTGCQVSHRVNRTACYPSPPATLSSRLRQPFFLNFCPPLSPFLCLHSFPDPDPYPIPHDKLSFTLSLSVALLLGGCLKGGPTRKSPTPAIASLYFESCRARIILEQWHTKQTVSRAIGQSKEERIRGPCFL